MKEINEWVRLLIYVVLCILIGIWIGTTYDKKEVIPTTTAIPPRPDNSETMYFDFYDDTWKYLFRSGRANEVKDSERPYNYEEKMQEYMEKKIPGYLEDTYWGEEYDLIDPDGPNEN